MKTTIGLLLTFLALANAQFHLTNALALQSIALQQEEIAKKAAAAASAASMALAVKAMEEAERQKEFNIAKEKGEPFVPDGTPIPENQNNGIRPNDPRTPTTFGNPFARANQVEEEISRNIMDAGLSVEELAMITAFEEGDLDASDFTFDDVHDTMLIANSTAECQARLLQNPCPHPCDCHKRQMEKRKCHETCSRRDSVGIVMCSIKRQKGKRRRESKVARELGLAPACDFNVYYEHPMMNSEALMTESLPGLFGTF